MIDYLRYIATIAPLVYLFYCLFRLEKVDKYMRKLIELDLLVNLYCVDVGQSRALIYKKSSYSRYESKYSRYLFNILIDLEEEYDRVVMNVGIELNKILNDEQLKTILTLIEDKGLKKLNG